MVQKDKVLYWINLASRDLETAVKLQNNNEFHWALFVGHLVLEKSIKSYFCLNNNETIPPKTHDLVKLAKSSRLILDEEQILFYNRVNDFNIEARYPDEKLNFYKLATPEFTKKNLDLITKEHLWIKSLLKL